MFVTTSSSQKLGLSPACSLKHSYTRVGTVTAALIALTVVTAFGAASNKKKVTAVVSPPPVRERTAPIETLGPANDLSELIATATGIYMLKRPEAENKADQVAKWQNIPGARGWLYSPLPTRSSTFAPHQLQNDAGIHVSYDKEAAKKLEEKTKKAAVRLTGMEASIHFMNEDPDFQILASTCSAPGIPGSVTVRFNLGLDGENAMGGTSKTRSKTVAFLALDEGGQPKTMTQLLKTEGTTTGASDMTVKLPIMLMYSPVDGSKTVTFSKIVDMDMVVVMEKLAEKRSKTTTWTGGVMSSVSHMKNGKMHGEMISFAQKTKIPGMGWIDVPESRFCYKDNMQVKTTGACLVD